MIGSCVLPNEHVVVLARDGRVYLFSPFARIACAELNRYAGDTPAAATALAERDGQHGQDGDVQRVEQDVDQLLTELKAIRMTPGDIAALGSESGATLKKPPRQPDDVIANSPMALAPTACAGTVSTIVGWGIAGAVRLALTLMPFRTMVSGLCRITTHRPASRAEVLNAAAAIDAAARWLPCRIACLERSFSVLLLLAACGGGSTCYIGARTCPLTLHAWLGDADGPIAEPASTTAYEALTVTTITTVGRSS